MQISIDIQEQSSRVRVLVKTIFCLGWNTVILAQIMENYIRITITLEEIDRARLTSKPVGLLLYIIMTSGNWIVATAKRR